MQHHLRLLGFKVIDKVTGFTGVVTSVCFDLYGCVQMLVTPVAGSNGEVAEQRWLDEKRLDERGTSPVMEVPSFAIVPGPAQKPPYPSGPR